jgi:hypothetical protein
MMPIDLSDDFSSSLIASDEPHRRNPVPAKDDEKYSEKETQRRFVAALKAAVNTLPKPLKDKPKVKAESRGKAKRRARKV